MADTNCSDEMRKKFEKEHPETAQKVEAIEKKYGISLGSKEGMENTFPKLPEEQQMAVMIEMMQLQKDPAYKKLMESKPAKDCQKSNQEEMPPEINEAVGGLVNNAPQNAIPPALLNMMTDPLGATENIKKALQGSVPNKQRSR